MALSGEAKKAYQRELMRKRRQAAVAVDKAGASTSDLSTGVDTEEWDSEKYPDKAAWEIAVVRAGRARRYALMFPEHVHPSEAVFGEVGWQYVNEGLPAVGKNKRTCAGELS